MFKKMKIFHIPVIVCLLVALTQFALSTSFSLTRWEGGGFGMYSEPNPAYSRIVWFRMENSNGDFRIRLYPTDKDLKEYINELPEKEKMDWKNLIKESIRVRNFPKVRASDTYIEEIGKSFLNVNEKTRNKMRRNNEKINVHLEIIEIKLDEKDRTIITRKMYSRVIKI